MIKNIKKIQQKLRRTPTKLLWILIIFFILVGTINFIAHINVPNTRNALMYGRIGFNMIDLGGEFSASEDAYNKPLGFVYLSIPFIKWWGSDIGLKILSHIIAVLWSLSLVPLFYRFRERFGVDLKQGWLYAVLMFFNPLVIYQFASAYPDLLFALSFIWSIYFLDRTLDKKVKWFDGLLFSLSFLFSVWVKHNGFILIPIAVIFIFSRLKEVKWIWQNRMQELLVFGGSSIVALVIIGLAQVGIDFDLFNFSHNTSNYTQGSGNMIEVLTTNFFFLGLYLVSTFSVLLIYLFKWNKIRKNLDIYLSLLVFVVSLIIYKGTWYNIRYYLTVMPFFVLIMIPNIQRLSSKWKVGLVTIFIFTNLYTVSYYNSFWFNDKGFIKLPNEVDNFRLMRDQKEAKENIDKVNELVKEKGYNKMIFYSNYVENSTWYVWERDGLFDENLEIKYRDEWDEDFYQSIEGEKEKIDFKYISVNHFLLYYEDI